MAIDKQSYTNTKHTGIKIHKDQSRFLFDFRIDGKRYSKTYKSNPLHTKADRLKAAYNTLESLKAELVRVQGIEADTEATVNDYYKIFVCQRRS